MSPVSMRVGPGNCTRAPHRTGREAACQTGLGRSTLGDDHGGQDWSHTGQAAHMQRRKPCRRVNYQNDGHAKPSISSSRGTVEPIKFVSAPHPMHQATINRGRRSLGPSRTEVWRIASLAPGTRGGATLRLRTPSLSRVGMLSSCAASSPQMATGVLPASSTTIRTRRNTAG